MYDEVLKPVVTKAVEENPVLPSPRPSTQHMGAMKPKAGSTLPNREQLERDTLRLLCSSSVKPGTRLEICRLLHPGAFLDPLRRTVFQEISAAGLIESRQLRATLPTLVRSRGFPDFALSRLLASRAAGEQEIAQLFASALCLLKVSGTAEPAALLSEADEEN